MQKVLFILMMIFTICGLSACGDVGNTEEPHTHEFSLNYDLNNHWEECSCGEKKTVEEHVGGEATCSALAICSVCDAEYGELASHSFKDYMNDNNATCTKNATETAKCENCDEVDTRELVDSKLEHTFDQKVTTNDYVASIPTCTQYGSYYYSCVCGAKGEDTFDGDTYGEHQYEEYEIIDNDSHKAICECGDSVVEEHTGGNATCDTLAICEKCDSEYGTVLSHNFELKFDENNHWNECVCGDIQNREAHHGGQATCNELAQCEVCLKPYGKYQHQYTEKVEDKKFEVKAPTCSEYGLYYYSCICGEIGEETFTGTILEEHRYEMKFDENNHWRACSCGDIVDLENHYGGIATCDSLAICEGCETPYGSIKHDYSQMIEDEKFEAKAPTCSEYGLYYYSCICGEVGSETFNGTILKDHEFNLAHNTKMHWYECICGETKEYEEHYGGVASEKEQAICEGCGQPYGDLVTPEVMEMFEYNLHLFKKNVETSYLVDVYYMNDMGERIDIYDDYYLESEDTYWVNLYVNAPRTFYLECYDAKESGMSFNHFVEHGLYNQFEVWVSSDAIYSYEEEFLKYHQVTLNPVENVTADFVDKILTMSWIDYQQEQYNLSYQVVITRDGVEELASFNVSSEENGFTFDFSCYSYGNYYVEILTIGDDYLTMSTPSGYVHMLSIDPVLPEQQEVLFDIIDFKVEIEYVDYTMFSVKVSWDTSVDLSSYYPHYNLSIADTYYYDYQVSNGGSYQISVESTEVSQIYNATLEISFGNAHYYGQQSATTTFEVAYETIAAPIISSVEVDVKNSAVFVEVETPEKYTELQYGIADYEGATEPMYWDSTMNTSFTLGEAMLQIRQEPYYLMVRVAVYESAMPQFSDWVVYKFTYYAEPEQLTTPTIKEVIWDAESQSLDISFDTTNYTSDMMEVLLSAYYGNSEVGQCFASTSFASGYGDDAWLSFSNVTFESGTYDLILTISCTNKDLYFDNEAIYPIAIEQKPIAEMLPQVYNIQVEVVRCHSGEPAELTIIVTWDEPVMHLPISGAQIKIEMQTGLTRTYDIVNGEALTIKSSTSSGVGVNMVGTYNCYLILKGDNYYSLDSSTYFEFVATETE